MIQDDIVDLSAALLMLLPKASRNDTTVLKQVCSAASVRFPRIQGSDNLAFWILLLRSKQRGTLAADTERLVKQLLIRRLRLGMSLEQTHALQRIDACLTVSTDGSPRARRVTDSVVELRMIQRADTATIADLRLTMAVLERVGDAGAKTFKKVADQLEQRPQSISETVDRVENLFSVALFAGTATKRRAEPTIEGEALLAYLHGMLGSWDSFASRHISTEAVHKKRPKSLRGARRKKAERT